MRKGGADKDDRIELSGADFHQKVYEGYLKVAKDYPDRFLLIDCLGEKQQTHENIIKALGI